MTSERETTGEAAAGAATEPSEERFEVSGDVVVERVEGELVLLELQRNEVFGLNDVGALVWERLAAGGTLREAIAAVTEGFEVDEGTATADVRELLAVLRAKGLLRAR